MFSNHLSNKKKLQKKKKKKKCWNNCGFTCDGKQAVEDTPEVPEPSQFHELNIDGTWENAILMDASEETRGI